MTFARPLALFALLLAASAVQAHPGHASPGFVDGLLHPLLGPDHLLGMLAIGLWSAWRGDAGGASWRLPAAFVMAAATGTLLGAAGLVGTGIETLLALSLLPLGLAVLRPGTLRTPLATALALGFGLLHGGAHGTEMGALADRSAAAGFLMGTVLLHAAGLGLARALSAHRRHAAQQVGAFSLAATSLWLLA
jgi:urease accessory protein